MSVWVVIFVCWVISFIFAGMEAGLLSLDQVRLRYQVKRGNRAAMLLHRLLQEPERLLATILLVTNLADIAALLLMTRRLVRWLGGWGYPVALLLAAPIYLFLLGVLPKSLFRRFPYRALAALAGLLEVVSRLLWPVLEIGAQIGRLVLRRRKFAPRLFAAREDVKQLTMESERQGALTAAERAMIHNVVDFRLVKVADVMVPRANVVAVEPETSVPDLVALSARTGIDRIVISRKKSALGLVNVLDVLLDRSSRALRDYMQPIVTAGEKEPAYRAIRRLRAAGLTLAAVVGTRNQLTGIVTLEDLVRRLVQSG